MFDYDDTNKFSSSEVEKETAEKKETSVEETTKKLPNLEAINFTIPNKDDSGLFE